MAPDDGDNVEEVVTLVACRIFCNIILHPFNYAKVLMQIGYEPLPPTLSTTIWGSPALYLPNVFTYLNHIKTVDGYAGLYRGLWPSICANIASTLAYEKASKEMHLSSFKENKHTGDNNAHLEVEEIEAFVEELKLVILIRSVTVLASHPFHVATVRTMSEFIGGEKTYDGCLCGLLQIYREEGVVGLFAGFVPRLLMDISVTFLSYTFTYALEKYLVKSKEYNEILFFVVGSVCASFFYPLKVVANTVAVSGSGLAAGSPPMMPLYRNWVECYTDLESKHQASRGISFWFRYVPVAAIQ